MPAAFTSRLHRLLTAGLAALLLLFGALLAASPAAAHDGLVSSDPPVDGSVETLPAEIRLSYSAALQTMSPRDTVVEVLAPSGSSVSEGDAVVDGAVVTQGLSTATEAGLYTVNWHVVSSDGHPTEGSFAFTVVSAPEPSATQMPPANDDPQTPLPSKKPVVTPTPTPETTTPTASTPVPADDDEDRPFGEMLPWILLGVTGVAAVGGITALLLARARGGAGSGGSDDPTEG